MESKLTLVLGASPKPERYSNMAVRRLRAHGHPVAAVGLRPAAVEDVPIVTDIPAGTYHTVTLYMNADNQRAWEDRILDLHPARIVFNPGAENPRLAARAEAAGIEVVEGCTLVMLSVGTF